MAEKKTKKKTEKKQLFTKEERLELKKKKCEIVGILLCALGIFSTFCIFTDFVGVVGELWGKLLFGLLGIVAYAMPVLFIMLGIISILAYNKKPNALKIFAVIMGVVAIFVLIHTLYAQYSNRFLLNDFGTVISTSWDEGVVNRIGSGIIGGLLFSAFYFLIDIVGCIILSLALLVISLLLLTNLSLKKQGEKVKRYVDNAVKKSATKKKARLYVGSVGEEERPSTGYARGGRQLKLPDDPEIEHEQEELPLIEEKKPVRTRTERTRSAVTPVEQPEDHRISVEEEMRYVTARDAKEYRLPPLSLLKQSQAGDSNSRENTAERSRTLLVTLQSFGITAQIQNITTGPSITRYELTLAPGIKLSKIQALQDDIALAMAANGIRIAPIPGKSTIGVEVPNAKATAVLLRDVLQSPEFLNSPSKICVGFGKDAAGRVITADLHKMPHLLIAGATGSGNSVCMNTIIASILFKARPDEVKLIMVDPKVVELSIYNDIPHLAVPVVTEPTKAAGALNWAKKKMIERYSMFAHAGVKDLNGYNAWAEQNEEEKLPQIVILIDELSDLMMVCGKDIEDSICRLAQMARAAGMYLVLATQRPSVDVITGLIKANIPSRIAFAVSSSHDSRTILDMVGAEKLLGKGDMLFYPTGEPKPIRAQGAFISEEEVENLVAFIKEQNISTDNAQLAEEIAAEMEQAKQSASSNKAGAVGSADDADEEDELFFKAVQTVILNNQSSISFLQRKLKIGFNRASTIIERMEEKGILSKPDPSNKNMRSILMSQEQFMLEYGERAEIEDAV